MKLLLIRHAESRGNLHRQWQGWLDEPLTDYGLEQARRLAERLHQWSVERSEPVLAVYGSTLARAFQTAGILARRWAVPLVLDSRLRERDVGVLIRFGNSLLSIVEIQDGLPRISLVNDTCHLE